jgi:large subunit ribosomal protein L19
VSRNRILERIEATVLNSNVALGVLPQKEFSIGDTIRVPVQIVEGEKTRVQMFEGVVLAKNGTGISETFTVRKTAHGCSLERVFLLNSPRLGVITIVQYGQVRRAKLYYLRDRTGKSAKIKQRYIKVAKKDAAASAEQPQA